MKYVHISKNHINAHAFKKKFVKTNSVARAQHTFTERGAGVLLAGAPPASPGIHPSQFFSWF